MSSCIFRPGSSTGWLNEVLVRIIESEFLTLSPIGPVQAMDYQYVSPKDILLTTSFVAQDEC